MTQCCVIIGASHAGAQLALSLRKQGWEGRILVLGDEPVLPYQRPPLSKGYFNSEKTLDDLLIRPADTYANQKIEFRLGERVERICRESKSIYLAGGERLTYDKLALCTGSRARQVDIPGATLPGVHYLRSLSDVDAIKNSLAASKNAVIIGGGYIGLETAASLRALDIHVVILEMAPRILARVTAEPLSAFYSRVHREHGVAIHCGVSVSHIEGGEQAERVCLASGESFAADLVIIGAGILPNVELAEAVGLAVDNGIVVDDYAVTSDPDIVACGDVTNHPNPIYGRRIRLESVPNAAEQAVSAAASVCGEQVAYSSLPWFWSDQYDLKLQIAGLSQGYDAVHIRGDLQSSSFAAFYFQGERLLAADCINRPQEFMLSKIMLSSAKSLAAETLVDESLSVKELKAML